MISVLVVEDDPIIRQGLTTVISQEAGLQLIAQAGDGAAAVAAARTHRPDVVVMDFNLPKLDGISATKWIVNDCPETRVLMLTVMDNAPVVIDALRAGASGFLVKGGPIAELIAAIHHLAEGEGVLDPAITLPLLESVRPLLGSLPTAPRWPGGLTRREREVLQGLARGRTNSELAAELGVAVSTVKTHVAQVLTKLKLHDRVQAVIYAYEHRLVDASVEL